MPPHPGYRADGCFAVQLAMGELRMVAMVGDWPAIPAEWSLDACRARRAAGRPPVA